MITRNLTSITDAIDSQYNRNIGYDALDQVTSVNGPWGTGTISYNSFGDITNWSLGNQYATYNYASNSNLLLSVQGSKSFNFNYDVIGNVTSDSTNTYTYNGVPNLVCVNCNDLNRKIQYAYDGVNNRIAVTKGGVKTYEIRDAKNNILIEFTPQTNQLIEYFYLGDKRISQRVSN